MMHTKLMETDLPKVMISNPRAAGVLCLAPQITLSLHYMKVQGDRSWLRRKSLCC